MTIAFTVAMFLNPHSTIERSQASEAQVSGSQASEKLNQ